MIDDNLNVINTWLGGELVVEKNKITSLLDKQLSSYRYIYPEEAYNTVKLPKKIIFVPDKPNKNKFKINVIKTELPGIMTFRECIEINEEFNSWKDILEKYSLCHLCVIERHGQNGEYAHGFLKNFNLKYGAVASSVGHDAHNIIVAGNNEDDMSYATNLINEYQGGVVIVNKGKLISSLKLPIAGLLSDKKGTEVAIENNELKQNWIKAGCTLPYMGFNLLPLSVIPNFRITNKGLVDVNSMQIVPLFEYD